MTGVAPRLRVGVLFPHRMLGGGETAVMEVAAGLAAELAVEIIVLARRPVSVEATIDDELRRRFGAVAEVRQEEELARRLAGLDALLWYGMNPFTPRVLTAMGSERPASVRVVHTSKPEEGVDYHRRWQAVIDHTVAVSPEVADRLPGAVFCPNPVPADRLRGPARRFFPASPRRTLGFLGRLFRFKNVLWLVEQLAALDADLLVQGLDTAELRRADLEAAAVRSGVGERVRFLPAGWDVGTLLKSVDAVALLSTSEGFPMVVPEAGAVATPVIATPVGALPRCFADELLFVPLEGERPQLAALRRAVAEADPGWGRRLQARVRGLCGRPAVVGAYAELLRRTVAERRQGGALAPATAAER